MGHHSIRFEGLNKNSHELKLFSIPEFTVLAGLCSLIERERTIWDF